MDKETEDKTSQWPKKMKKTICLRRDLEQGADWSDVEEEDQLEEEDDQLEDNVDVDDNINQGNTDEEGGDGGDSGYVDDNAEKEREPFIDLDNEVSTIDITVPLLLIDSSLFADCGG